MTELFYFVPMHLAAQLHQVGQYTAALDWFRTVYGYNLPVGQCKVYYGLKQEETIPSVYQTTDQWLRTTLNPHDIAPERAGAFTRFTIISIYSAFSTTRTQSFPLRMERRSPAPARSISVRVSLARLSRYALAQHERRPGGALWVCA